MYNQENFKQKLVAVTKELEAKLIEREEIIRLILLTIFSKHHAFLIGLPGVAKTQLLQLTSSIVEDASFWQILMTKETKEKHLLGEDIEEDSVDKFFNLLDKKKIIDFQSNGKEGLFKQAISLLNLNKHKNTQDVEEAKQQSSMLYHHFILFDEMFKASDDLLVSCLPMLNERYYTSKGRAHSVPLNSMFSASNELPTGEKIEPFVDRLLVWYEVKRIEKKENMSNFINGKFDKSKKIITKFSLDEIEFCNTSANEVKIPSDIEDLYILLEHNIYKDGIKVSNRKFGPDYIVKAMKVCAWLNGRMYLNISDLLLVRHMAWQNFIEKNKLEDIVHDTIFGAKYEAEKNINNILKEFNEAKSFYQAEIEMTISHSVDYFGADGASKFDLFIEKLNIYYQRASTCLSQMEVIYSLYTRTQTIEKQILENIFLIEYKARTFSDKNVLTKVESFIHEEKTELSMLNDWYVKNKSMADYQQSRNKILSIVHGV